jgi:magnesium-transporting ATPase (P-type)
MILGVAIIGIGFPLRGIQLTVITTVTITIPALGLTLWANPGVLYGNSLRKSLSHFIIPVAITIAIAGIVTFFSFNDGVLNNEYAHLAVTYTLVFTGLLVVLFLRPPFRLLVGGAPLSRDRRILSMVIVLTVLFLLTVALTSAISFLQNLLLLQWLHPLGDFLTILVIVIVWAIVLLLIWRIWRSSGIWDHQGASPEEAIGNDPQGIPDQSSEK